MAALAESRSSCRWRTSSAISESSSASRSRTAVRRRRGFGGLGLRSAAVPHRPADVHRQLPRLLPLASAREDARIRIGVVDAADERDRRLASRPPRPSRARLPRRSARAAPAAPARCLSAASTSAVAGASLERSRRRLPGGTEVAGGDGGRSRSRCRSARRSAAQVFARRCGAGSRASISCICWRERCASTLETSLGGIRPASNMAAHVAQVRVGAIERLLAARAPPRSR